MKYLRMLLGALLIAVPVYVCLLLAQTGASEEQLYTSYNDQMERLAKQAKLRLFMDKNMVVGAIKVLAGDKDYANKLKEFYQLATSKKNTEKQAERLAQLQTELLSSLTALLGPGLDISLVSSAGQVLLASEKAPYPVGTDIKHTTLFKYVRSGYLFNDIEVGFTGDPVTLAAMPLATADGAMALLLSFPIEQRATAIIESLAQKEQMSWVISIGNKVVQQGGNGKLHKVPALADKATVYGNFGVAGTTPKFLKHPEFCGQISVAVPVVGNIPEMSLGFVMDTSPSYAHINNSQAWALYCAIIAAIIFIIFSFVTDWRAHQSFERLCDHLSSVIKGTKTNGDLSVAHFHDDLKRIVVLVNKLVAIVYANQRKENMANLVSSASPLQNMLSSPDPDPIAVTGLSATSVNSANNNLFGAMINEDEATASGVESSLDSSLINQITNDMQEAQNSVQAAVAPIPSDKEMLGALNSLEPMGKETTDVSGVFIPEANNRPNDEFNSLSSLYNERTYSAVPLPSLNLPEEPLDMGEMSPMAATPESIPDMIDDQLDMAALERAAAQNAQPAVSTPVAKAAPIIPEEPVEEADHQNSTVIMPLSMINATLASSHSAPTVPVEPPPPSDAFQDYSSLPEHTQMGPIPTAALLELAKSQNSQPVAPVDPEEALYKAVFEDYERVRQECGESIAELNYAKFAQKLRDTKTKVLATHNCRDVRFSVQNKNGKATLKAAPVK